MCKYLNDHINSGLQSRQSSSSHLFGVHYNQQSTPDSARHLHGEQINESHDGDAPSDVFSARQYDSNAQQSASGEAGQQNLQDSRPSFGNSYVNNFIREEE